MEMEEDGKGKGTVREKVVLMSGYLPGASPQRSPLLYPVAVRPPESAAGGTWRDVFGGGCGFAMAIADSGKLLTWGSADDMGESYVASGKHELKEKSTHGDGKSVFHQGKSLATILREEF